MPKKIFDAEAALLLDSIVENGDTDGMQAKDVQKKWSKFDNINGNTFRAKLKRARDKFREKNKGDGMFTSKFFLFPTNVFNIFLDVKKMKLEPRASLSSFIVEDEDQDSDVEFVTPKSATHQRDPSTGAGAELILSEFNFKPIYNIGIWESTDGDGSRRVSVAILLFSGSDKKNQVKFKVLDGQYLEYTFIWPSVMLNADDMHSRWLNGRQTKTLLSYHPMISCFRSFVSRMRGNNDCIRTTARIPLPFPVESRFDVHFNTSQNSTARIAYVILRAPSECVDAIAGDEDIEFE